MRVLVLEDDYLLAWDVSSTLEAAGAELVGPFAEEAPAIEAVRKGNVTAALVDVNLGSGPSFEFARILVRAKVPFAFLTGYGGDAFPDDFSGIACLQKPVDGRLIVSELVRIVREPGTE